MLASQRSILIILGLAVTCIYVVRLTPSNEAAAASGEVSGADGVDATAAGLTSPPSNTTAIGPLESNLPVAPPAPSLVALSHSEGLPTGGQWRGKPCLADIDGDGALDIVSSIRRKNTGEPGEGLNVWLGDGQGGWTPTVQGIRRDMGYGGAAVADIDGDGDLDIAYSSHDTEPQVFTYEGAGAWSSRSEGISSYGVCSDVAFGDLDGDGIPELVTLGFFASKGGLKVFKQGAEGNWESMAELVSIRDYGAQVRTIDLDGDGRSEIVAATSLGARVWSYEDGEFIDESEGLRAPDVLGADLVVDAFDFDADGYAELVVGGMIYEGHPPIRAYRWNGSAWEDWGSGLPAGEALFDLDISDLDGDGLPEIVGAGRFGLLVATMVSTGQFETLGRVDRSEGIINITTGDVNGDGFKEVLYVGFGGVRVLDLSSVLRSSS